MATGRETTARKRESQGAGRWLTEAGGKQESDSERELGKGERRERENYECEVGERGHRPREERYRRSPVVNREEESRSRSSVAAKASKG